LLERVIAEAKDLLSFRGEDSLQNLHPVVIHFPIAFLTGASVLYLLVWIVRREVWAWTGLWMLTLGTIGAAIAVSTGIRASAGVMIAPSVRDHILVYHRNVMLIVFALSLALSLWALSARPIPRRGRSVFVLLLCLMTGLLAIGADFGGWMVYGYNAGGSLPQPIEFSP
jgi:uncharacterized membrane protein